MPERLNFEETDDEIPETEIVFREYMENLKLAPDDFHKKILDVGSGGGEFAKWASEHGVSKSIYSLDKNAIEDFSKTTVRGAVEKLPLKDGSFELVISHASIPTLLYVKPDVQKSVRESLAEMLRVLKPGGEIRVAPVADWQKIDALRQLVKTFSQELDALQLKQKIVVDKISLGQAKYSEGNLEQFLYKIKKL